MIKSITVTNHLDESLVLELAKPEDSGFAVTSVTGLGPGKATINVTEVSTDDGGLYNSSRLSTRNIVISLRFYPQGSDTVEDIRQKSYKYFPNKKNVTLLIETENRVATIEGRVEENDPNIFDEEEGTDISIICPYPYFYSAGEGGSVETIFSGIEAGFMFPFSNESLEENLLEMGTIHVSTEEVITYSGDAEIGVTITIHAVGTASNITIYNTGTRELMTIDTDKIEAYTGSGIVSGDEIVICTVKKNKSIVLIRNGVTTNILNCLSKDTDWFQLTRGDNVFAYTADSGASNLQFKIESQVIYEGI